VITALRAPSGSTDSDPRAFIAITSSVWHAEPVLAAQNVATPTPRLSGRQADRAIHNQYRGISSGSCLNKTNVDEFPVGILTNDDSSLSGIQSNDFNLFSFTAP